MNHFLEIWQTLPSHVSPILGHLGPLEIRVYGVMYGLVFLCTYALVLQRIKNEPRFSRFSREVIQTVLIAATIGAIGGARIGYVLFYNWNYFFTHLSEIVLPVHVGASGVVMTGFSGMSYHGGLIGAAIGAWIATRLPSLKSLHMRLLELGDLIAPAFPLGFTFGRLGNFFNGELWGRVTHAAIGMYFPNSALDGALLELRHPSQLYEALGEGVVLFVILWLVRKKIQSEGALFGLYVCGYGVVRFFLEFFREPDAQVGFLIAHLSMGQLLSSAMIVVGGALFVRAISRARSQTLS